ncbi:MAG TPA: hypothetical protein VGE62_00570 [Candidatus Paceibacterota bacterium]
MNIVTVYPIVRRAFKEELTYWSSHSFKPGSIIEVPLRGKGIPALVGSVSHASHAKANIKQASFVTKKIEKKSETQAVLPECVMACVQMSELYVSALGTTLKACIPDVAFESKAGVKIDEKKKGQTKKRNGKDDGTDENDEEADDDEGALKAVADIVVYQTNFQDRLSTYKSIVREEFARKKTVIIVAPTVASAEELYQSLKRGIDDYAVVIHGKLSRKKQLEIWEAASTDEHPLLIVTTPLFACVPRTDISTIIIEKESSRGYATMRAPFIDFRDYIECYAKQLGIRLILGDSMLRIETLFRRETGELADFFPVSYRIEKTADVLVVNTNPKKPGPDAKNPDATDKTEFKLMSEELVSMIDYAGKKGDNMFIFSARRGLSPQTVCGHCSQTVECHECGAPVVLHENKKAKEGQERYFLCHHCGTQRGALETCKKCGSWKLTTLGIGIDTVAAEVKKLFPEKEVFTIDRDSVKTDKQARDIIKDFSNAKGAVLVGTETALAFLPELKYSAIASLDSLFSIPDFRIHERIIQLLLRILDKTTAYMLIQTRSENAEILSHFTSGNLSQFYKDELEMRQQVNYPPFATHVKVTVEETKEKATDLMKILKERLDKLEEKDKGSFSTLIFPAFVPTQKGRAMLHLLITLKPGDWPHAQLSHLLRSLPPEFQIRVNPESLL